MASMSLRFNPKIEAHLLNPCALDSNADFYLLEGQKVDSLVGNDLKRSVIENTSFAIADDEHDFSEIYTLDGERRVREFGDRVQARFNQVKSTNPLNFEN